jgi:hypothetical protein
MRRMEKEIGSRRAGGYPSVENLGPGAWVNGLPDAEVERNLHAGLRRVVGLGNLDPDGDPLGMRLDLAEAGNAVGTPKKTDELVGQPRIAQSYEHLSHFL